MNQTIAAKNLTAGTDFIFNYAGGNRTVYHAERVSAGAGRAVIAYTIPGSALRMSEFHCAGLSTLTLV